jgi:tetratricopeptide (TPR) repeat protein
MESKESMEGSRLRFFMYEKKISKYSRRDLFRGVVRHVRGRGREDEASGLSPEVFEADALLRKDKYAEAARLYSACVEREPDHAEAWQRLGYCRFKLGLTRDARQALEQLNRIKPGNDFAALYTGLAHAMDGNTEKAIDSWKSYFDISQPLIQREINLILALHERGDKLDPAQLAKSVQDAVETQKQSRR